MTRRLAVLLSALSVGCNQAPPPLPFPSLEVSGDVSFLCLNGNYEPREMRDCRGLTSEGGEFRRTVSMVTQLGRGEVAVVDYIGGPVDTEPTVPGIGFLPVGAQPVDIVSTPGSVATFVGVGQVGQEGIFALPTSCIGPRDEDLDGSTVRDLTTWPACRLPTTPGDMAVVVDPADDAGNVRASCDGIFDVPGADAADRRTGECLADLSQEVDPPGRRKLLVSLPAWGEVAVIDAQWLLDQPQGSFEPCVLERRLALAANVPAGGVSQRPPEDLDVSGCALPGFNHGPPETIGPTRPAGFATMDDRSRIYVADQEAPVIHVLDTRSPCDLVEREPLLPVSFTDPDRVVTTRKVAVSPRTRDGSRFLYAIDDGDGGSVMVFDVTEGSADRTPIVRPRSPSFPFEPPDRISFAAPAKDVTFGFREEALEDLPLGNEVDGVLCDPDPALSSDDPGAQRRPTADFTRGAAPRELRGIFGFLALSTGEIAVVDVEDWDAPCRRPVHTNPGAQEDFRGCAGDPFERFYTAEPADPDAPATVSGEVSCQVVQPHRWRSANLMISDVDFGVRAPSLRSLPRLTSDVGRRLPTDQSEQGRAHPKMLGVDFSDRDPAEVFVGSTRRRREEGADSLVIDPALAQESSLVLSFAEPRLYPATEAFNAVYEGEIIAGRPSARLERDDRTPGGPAGPVSLFDSGIVFCDRGVEDESLMARTALDLGVAEESVPRFVADHVDYVVVTSAFLGEDHPYWRTPEGASCGGATADQPGASRAQCRSFLGTPETPRATRQLSVVKATRSRLDLRPRGNYSSADQQFVVDLLECCFPEPIEYSVRASDQWVVTGGRSGFRHRITTSREGDCIRDCSPLRQLSNGRAFEIACDPDDCPIGEDEQPVIGLATARDVACVTSQPSSEYAQRQAPGTACVFSNATTSFAIYRGLEPSRPGMAFAWDVVGGFSPLIADLRVTDGPDTVPISMNFVPHLGALAITDGATKGLSFVFLENFSSTPLRYR